jgi:hypothetical protein
MFLQLCASLIVREHGVHAGPKDYFDVIFIRGFVYSMAFTEKVFHRHVWNKKVFHSHVWNKQVFHSHVWNKKVFHSHVWNKKVFHSTVWTMDRKSVH